jgi:DNA helicase II / ATP-dependent DNA helicase PcrA
VGITRAERKLYLTFARRRRRGGEWLDSTPSSFLESIPPELAETRKSARLEERFTPRQPWRSPAFGAGAPRRRQRLGFDEYVEPLEQRTVDYAETQEQVRLVKGARVRHPQFGSGTVAELSGFGVDVRATIDFESVGRKRVVVRYANLQPDWD